MLEITLLPARQGDAIWIRWSDKEGCWHQMFIDMGTNGAGSQIRKRLAALPEAERAFELLVVTHIDSDHIGGVLSCVAKHGPPPGVTFEDVWFNGVRHLTETPKAQLTDMSGAEGQKLTDWLRARTWNTAFDGNAVCIGARPISLPGGLTVTVLGPTRERLAGLADHWTAVEKEFETEIAKGETVGGFRLVEQGMEEEPPDLPALALDVTGADDSAANGSSIVLLCEYRGLRFLFAGDAYAGDLVDALQSIGGSSPTKLSAFKLPHHGSLQNMTQELMAAVDCPLFLFSSDGTRFDHPDREAVACVIKHGRRSRAPVELGFNVRSDQNRCWDNESWARQLGYRARYGGDASGLTVRYVR